jgi:hypothetical protein
MQLTGAPALGCRRQRVVGIDLWVHAGSPLDLLLSLVRQAASSTHLRLAGVLEEPAEGGGENGLGPQEPAGVRLRFLARLEDTHLTDQAIWELVEKLPPGLRWWRLLKLEEFDGVPDFVPLPAL